MQGLFFNAIEEAVVTGYGYAAWDGLLAEAGLDGTWTSSGTYADQEVMALVQQAAAVFGLSIQDTLIAVGRQLFIPLFARYPAQHEFRTPEDLLMGLDTVIHVEVRKAFDEATPPRFDVERIDNASLLVRYASERQLCWLAVGLILGCGDAFGRKWEIDHVECVTDEGVERRSCLMVVRDA